MKKLGTFREYLAESKIEKEIEINETANTQKLNSKIIDKLFNSNNVSDEFVDLTGNKVKGTKVIIMNKDNMIVKFKDKITCFDKHTLEDTSIYFDTTKL